MPRTVNLDCIESMTRTVAGKASQAELKANKLNKRARGTARGCSVAKRSLKRTVLTGQLRPVKL